MCNHQKRIFIGAVATHSHGVQKASSPTKPFRLNIVRRSILNYYKNTVQVFKHNGYLTIDKRQLKFSIVTFSNLNCYYYTKKITISLLPFVLRLFLNVTVNDHYYFQPNGINTQFRYATKFIIKYSH